MLTSDQGYTGYAVFARDHHPIGVVSQNSDRKAYCNLRLLPRSYGKFLTSIEDQRFYHHGAIDPKSILRALFANLKKGKIVQGGSTITQQLARNILRDNRRTLIRKIRELNLAIDIESEHTKEEILELYLNHVFWGKQVYGLRAASLEYFSKEPTRLALTEQLALLTLLRGPNFYLQNQLQFQKRYKLLSRLLIQKEIVPLRKVNSIEKAKINLQNNNLQVFKNESIPHLVCGVNKKYRSITTTVESKIQKEALRFVNKSNYPTSLICLTNGQITAVASSNGAVCPFTFKTNVGSTLKPFVYTFLRESGISLSDTFSTKNVHNLDWNIREVDNAGKDFVTLKEALLQSNNNAFVNASFQVGIEQVLSFLTSTLGKHRNDLVPATILGATTDGLSLFELAKLYDTSFHINSSPLFSECKDILREISINKFGIKFYDSFLKTGTTNSNRERFALVGVANTLFAFLRQGNEVDDFSKEGNFIAGIMHFLKRVAKSIYKW